MRSIQFLVIVALLSSGSYENQNALHCERVKCRYEQREKSMHSVGEVSDGGDNIEVSDESDQISSREASGFGERADKKPQGFVVIRINPGNGISIKILRQSDEKTSSSEVSAGKAADGGQLRPMVHQKSLKELRNSTSHQKPLKTTEKPQKFCETFTSLFSLNDEDLSRMTDCHEIDFSANNLGDLQITFTADFHQLEVVNFDRNNISSLPPSLLASLTNLKVFSAKFNQIQTIDELFFTSNSHLESVDLSHNHLRHIPIKLFIRNVHLKFVSLKSNACVNHAYPDVTMEHLIGVIGVNCSNHRGTVYEFIAKLIQLLSQSNGTSGESDADAEEDNQVDWTTADLDALLTGLFWLIVPIILMLLGICGMIFYVIYNKFVVYGVRARRDSER